MRRLPITFAALALMVWAAFRFLPWTEEPTTPSGSLSDNSIQRFSESPRPARVRFNLTPNPEEESPVIPFEVFKTMSLDALVDRLYATALPEAVIRAIAKSRAEVPYRDRVRELQAALPRTPYWKPRPTTTGVLTGEQYAELGDMIALAAEQVNALLGPAQPSSLQEVTQRARYGNLPLEKIAEIERINADYAAMQMKVRGGSITTPLLPEDRTLLAMLEAEKEKDIRSALTPAEYEELIYRSSNSTMQLRTTLNGFQPTEAEFRTLFAIQQAFDEEYPVNSPNADPNVRLARTQATPRLRQQIAEALSPARRAEFEAAQQ